MRSKTTQLNVFNVDETGLTIVQIKVSNIVGLRGKRQIAALTSAEARATITVIACMVASEISDAEYRSLLSETTDIC